MLSADQLFFGGGFAGAAGAFAVESWRANTTMRCTLSLSISASRPVPPFV